MRLHVGKLRRAASINHWVPVWVFCFAGKDWVFGFQRLRLKRDLDRELYDAELRSMGIEPTKV